MNLAQGLLPWLLAVPRGSAWAAATDVWCTWTEELIPTSLPGSGRIINISKLFLSSSDEKWWKKGVSYLFHRFFPWAPLNFLAMTATPNRDVACSGEITVSVRVTPPQPRPVGRTGVPRPADGCQSCQPASSGDTRLPGCAGEGVTHITASVCSLMTHCKVTDAHDRQINCLKPFPTAKTIGTNLKFKLGLTALHSLVKADRWSNTSDSKRILFWGLHACVNA